LTLFCHSNRADPSLPWSGSIEKWGPLLAPLRDLFAAISFAFVGLSVDPSTIPPALTAALVLAALGAVTKLVTARWGGRRAGLEPLERTRAGATLISRGEFSIAIAGLAASAGLEPRLTSVTVPYVMALAVAGPIAARLVEPLSSRMHRRFADGYRVRAKGGQHDERSRHQALHPHQGSCR
jgi:K+:H+ antiporter subunit KhtU